MDFQLPAEDDPRRVVVQEWIRPNLERLIAVDYHIS